MALLSVCDRCRHPADVSPCFGSTAELCRDCAAEFEDWWAKGKAKAPRKRGRPPKGQARPGQAYRDACDLIGKFGFASPDDFAAKTRLSRRQSYDRLKSLERIGLLEGGSQPGLGVRFCLAQQRAEAAE